MNNKRQPMGNGFLFFDIKEMKTGAQAPNTVAQTKQDMKVKSSNECMCFLRFFIILR